MGLAVGSQGEAAVLSWVQYKLGGWGGHELAGHAAALLQLTLHEQDVTQSTVPHADGPAQSIVHGPGPQLIPPHAAIPLAHVMSQPVPSLQSMSLQALVPLHLTVQS